MNEALDYLTVIGTFGAFLTAVGIFWWSSVNSSQDRRQTQAVLFDVWLARVTKQTGIHVAVFNVSNHSDQAIRDLTVEINNAQSRNELAVVQPTFRGLYLDLIGPNIVDTPRRQQ